MPIDPSTALLISSGAETGGGLFNTIFGGRARKKQRKHEMALAEYAYNKDLEQWNRANEYNLPENQRQRLINAGLNPALMYKTAPQNVAIGTAPKYQAPRAEYGVTPFNIGGAAHTLAQYQNVQQSKAQTDNIKKNAQLTEEKILTETVNRALKSAGVVSLKYKNLLAKELSKYNADLAKSEMIRVKNRARKYISDADFSEKRKLFQEYKNQMAEIERNWMRDTGTTKQDKAWIRRLLQFGLLEMIIEGANTINPWKK